MERNKDHNKALSSVYIIMYLQFSFLSLCLLSVLCVKLTRSAKNPGVYCSIYDEVPSVVGT